MLLRAYARFANVVGDQAWFRPVSQRFIPFVDKLLIPLGLRSTPWPTLLLTTTGRKSGEAREAPLFFVESADGLAVLGTNYGRPEPNWSLNLRAEPDCSYQLDRRTVTCRARVATETEFDDLFPRFVEFYDSYTDYRARAGRDIPIWILEEQG